MFVLMTVKEQLTTREGKPYFRVGFRDGGREVDFPIWDNSPWAAECRDKWTPGAFYKVRAVYRETNYGPQLDIRKIREVCEADAADGFDARSACRSPATNRSGCSRRCSRSSASGSPTRPCGRLVEKILTDNRDELLRIPAARHNHHAFVAGWLEHTLSVTRTVIYLADKYAEYYDELEAAAGQVDGRGRRDLARHRQAARVGAAARGHGLHGQRGLDRPLAAGPRHRPRGGRRPAPCRPTRSCGWSTLSLPISDCPNGARPSRP